jgi:hypothetical protein
MSCGSLYALGHRKSESNFSPFLSLPFFFPPVNSTLASSFFSFCPAQVSTHLFFFLSLTLYFPSSLCFSNQISLMGSHSLSLNPNGFGQPLPPSASSGHHPTASIVVRQPPLQKTASFALADIHWHRLLSLPSATKFISIDMYKKPMR